MSLKGISKHKRREVMVYHFKQGVIESTSLSGIIKTAKEKGWKREDIVKTYIWEEV